MAATSVPMPPRTLTQMTCQCHGLRGPDGFALVGEGPGTARRANRVETPRTMVRCRAWGGRARVAARCARAGTSGKERGAAGEPVLKWDSSGIWRPPVPPESLVIPRNPACPPLFGESHLRPPRRGAMLGPPCPRTVMAGPREQVRGCTGHLVDLSQCSKVNPLLRRPALTPRAEQHL